MSQSIPPGARIGILGVNGAGKSTLLKCLVGDLQPLRGEFSRGQHCQIGYFAQHQLETLNPARTPLQHVQTARPREREQWCRNYLGGWGFASKIAERSVATLSGGEKARLVLAMIALTAPALLVLDEPTNHLDLEMRAALALALQEYTGALLLVSHDRNLLRSTVDEFWMVANGSVNSIDTDLEDYAEAFLRAHRGPQAGQAVAPSGVTDRKTQRRAAAEQRQREKPLRDDVKRLEKEIDQLTARLGDVESRLADPDVYRSLPPAELDELLAEAGRLRKRRDVAEQSWISAAEALESLGQAS